MPIINNIQSSFGTRKNKLTSPITAVPIDNIVAETITKAKVTILQVKPIQNDNGYRSVKKQRNIKKLENNPLNNGLLSKKNKMMF